MRTPELARIAGAAWAVVLLAGCSATVAPPGWLPPAEQAQQQAYGAWIRVQYRHGEEIYHVAGELIAVEADSLYVLNNEDLLALARQDITKSKLGTYDSQAGTLGGWTGLGALSTLSHGVLLIFSLPLWLAAGIASTHAQSHASLLEYPHCQWDGQRPYARFPGGLPPGMSRLFLESKPGTPPTPPDGSSGRSART
jgi:hypothetical protein